MSIRKEISISEIIKTASSPSIRIGRIFGLFPFVIEQKGPHLFLKWSLKFAVYSLLLGFILVTFTIKGMIEDLSDGNTKSIRMKHSTAKYVTIGDISIVVLIVFVGIFGVYLRFSGFLSFVNCINEIDKILVVSDARKARKLSIFRLCVILVTVTTILIIDLSVWWIIADDSMGFTDVLYRFSNIPFYICYYVVFMLEFQYWYLIYCVNRRLKLMNDCLRIECITPQEMLHNIKNKAFVIFKESISSSRSSCTSVHNMENVVGVLKNPKKLSDLFFIRNAKRLKEFTVDDCVLNIIKIYLLLCDAADFVNRCCGFPILIILISCLLHLVVTPYFMVLELTGRKNMIFFCLQAIWLFTHIIRLVIIVEACYGSTIELKKTRPLVCKLLIAFDSEDKIKRHLEMFAGELNYRTIEYTACGLFTIDRTLITTIAGAVTTYLVVLLQFQKTSDNFGPK